MMTAGLSWRSSLGRMRGSGRYGMRIGSMVHSRKVRRSRSADDLTPAHLSNEQRNVLRPVALAYRRAYRAGASEGECCDAALREYRRVCPDAPADQLLASGEVGRMASA